MEVKTRIKCCGRYDTGPWIECDEYFEYWAHMDIEIREDHDTFGSRTYSELTFSGPEEVPAGWSKDSVFTKTHRYICDMCNDAMARQAEAERSDVAKTLRKLQKDQAKAASGKDK